MPKYRVTRHIYYRHVHTAETTANSAPHAQELSPDVEGQFDWEQVEVVPYLHEVVRINRIEDHHSKVGGTTGENT